MLGIMTNILMISKWKKMMDKYFIGAKWFKCGQVTFLAETQ
jgi:hypothetical protein